MKSFEVHGRPIPWQRTRSAGKRRILAPKYRAWREQIAWAARAAHITEIDGPVGMRVAVRCADNRVGDVDNYAKAVMDALEGVAYADDKQIVELRVERAVNAKDPGLTVEIWEEVGHG